METIESLFDFLRMIISVRALYLVVIVSMICGLYWWARGILPAVIRLGNGLAKRNIAIFAKNDNFTVLNNLLVDSTLFNKKNIFSITQESDIGKAKKATVYLLQWDDWAGSYKKILDNKPDGCALIVYAPPRAIPDNDMKELELHRNTIVTNFRGRLLNDIVTSMITTGYDRR